jgi:hypothetical protein
VYESMIVEKSDRCVCIGGHQAGASDAKRERSDVTGIPRSSRGKRTRCGVTACPVWPRAFEQEVRQPPMSSQCSLTFDATPLAVSVAAMPPRPLGIQFVVSMLSGVLYRKLGAQ